MADNYVNLKNLQGAEIKPITDLAAVNLTEVNGIAVIGNTIGIQDGYVESAYYTEMIDAGVGPAHPSETYIEGGTMFTLIGGYTVSDEIPPAADADPYKIPSELSVRSAIDAIATLGPSLTPGAGIVVTTVPGSTGGILSVAEGNGVEVNTAQQGGVSVKAGNGITVDTNGVSVNTATNNTFGGIAGATNGVTLVDGVAQVDAGDGLLIDNGKVVIDEASVEATLQDVRIDEGSTVSPVDDQVLTPGNLRGALSVGQAVDVSCCIATNAPAYEYSVDGTNWLTLANFIKTNGYLSDFSLRIANATPSASAYFGFRSPYGFPKFASGLKYLFIADIRNAGAAATDARFSSNVSGGMLTISSIPYGLSGSELNASQTTYTRIACVSTVDTLYMVFKPSSANTTIQLDIKNWRQYEVTALTDDAIAYIAQLPDPDAFFRSTSVYSLRDKYLVKQDMVCPFIPTISMPDNSDLTVAAGLSYKIRYTNDNPHIITADTIPVDGYGWDTHIQMFIKGTSSIVFQQPLILMDALTPNAGHNLSIKWRDGDALVYVDDTNAGNIVVAATGTTAGTLNYFLQQDPGSGEDNYIIFAAATDGLTCDAGTVSVAYNTDVLGNGTDATTITGSISAASGKTINFQELSISGSTFGGAGGIILTATAITDGMEVVSGSTITFSGTNTLNSTLAGAGGIKFDSGAVLTSDIQSGSTIGTGVLGIGINAAATGPNNVGMNLTIENITFTGITDNRIVVANTGAADNPKAITLRNVRITGNTDTTGELPLITLSQSNRITMENCIAEDNHGYTLIYGYGQKSEMYIKDSVIEDVTLRAQGTNYIFQGTNSVYRLRNWSTAASNTGKFILTDGSTTTISYGITSIAQVPTIIGAYENGAATPSGTATIIIGGHTETLSGCVFINMSSDGVITGLPDITCGSMDVWSATDAIFGSPLDVSAVNGVKLTSTTFTATAKTLNANRIQLPAATTVSFQGNSNAADTKILEASVIVVGDDAVSPSGSATIINATGTASTVSGIGTYIDKEGDNDFVALTSVSTVSTSATSGAGSLPAALTGSNKFVRLGDGTVGTVGEATDAVNKQIITHDYEPIIGGTFSLTSATVDDATKTVAIQSGGTMSIVDIRGGKGSVIDLNKTHIVGGGSASGVIISGGSTSNYGGAWYVSGGSAVITDCVFTSNTCTASNDGAAIRLANYALITGCTFSENTGAGNGTIGRHAGNEGADIASCLITKNTGGGVACAFNPVNLSGCTITSNTTNCGVYIYQTGSAVTITDCVITDNSPLDIRLRSRELKLYGSNRIGTIGSSTDSGTLTLTSGAILDLTGNTNTAPIAPGGGITFEQGGATVLYSSGAVSGSYMMDNVTLPAGAKLTNTEVVNLGGGHCYVSSGTSISASGCVFSGGSAAYGGAFDMSVASTAMAFSSCSFIGNVATATGGGIAANGAVSIKDCVFSNNTVGGNPLDIAVLSNATLNIDGGCEFERLLFYDNGAIVFGGVNSVGIAQKTPNATGTVTISSGASINLTSSINPGGGITVLTGGCTVNGNAIPAGTYTSIDSNGQPTE